MLLFSLCFLYLLCSLGIITLAVFAIAVLIGAASRVFDRVWR